MEILFPQKWSIFSAHVFPLSQYQYNSSQSQENPICRTFFGIGVYGDPGLAEAVRRDPLGIGYNNVNFAYDGKTLEPVSGLAVCPIDLDGSGTSEPREAVYATRDDLTRAIAAGVYPSPPARDLYFVIKGQPARPLLAEFLTWVLTDGQRYVAEMGYIAVGPDRIAAGLASVRATTERK